MLQIPKNVMQIGEVNAHTKIYMEDYVHTFLERRKKAEEYLAFGKKEERDGVLYYLIYGVEKRTDWDRGSYPYFKKYERIGTIEGTAARRTFKPVRGSSILLDGYFIFYEQNEDMQSYMIVVREAEEIAGSEEKEEVMEAVRTHREQRKKELEAAEMSQNGKQENAREAVRDRETKKEQTAERARYREAAVQSLQKKAKRNAFSFGKKEEKEKKENGGRIPRALRQPKAHAWTIPDLCRAGSMLLLLLLVVMGLTSINRYPDMKAVTELFSDAAKAVSRKEDAVTVDAKPQDDGLIVEEEKASQEESAEIAEAAMDEAESGEDLVMADDGAGTNSIAAGDGSGANSAAEGSAGTIQWMIGQQETQSAAAKETEAAGSRAADNQPDESSDAAQPDETEEESATQAIARPVSYVVKKGDNLAEIARKFYGNTSMIKEICRINQIEDPNQIHPGQNILLP